MVLMVALLLSRPTPGEVSVRDIAGLREALRVAGPGTTIVVQPGLYAGGLWMSGLHGAPGKPIAIRGADPKNPPSFVQGGVQMDRVSDIDLSDLTVVGSGATGSSANALNVHDGGTIDKPSHHIRLRSLHVSNVLGPGDNGIKMAGVDDFTIEGCDVRDWGGCAIDLVGCHRGVIQGCRFVKGGGVGVQAKGASADVTVRRCRFEDYGGRGVNLGGSTGIPFFRPALAATPIGQRHEAKNLRVEGCVFVGGDAPVAFTGVDGATVRFNTILRPRRWALRILQETATPDFVPSRNGRLEDNLVVFRSGWSEGGVNVGPGTAPSSFAFARNFWFCEDRLDRSQPSLPVPETGGTVGVDPRIDGRSVSPGSPAAHVGAHAFKG